MTRNKNHKPFIHRIDDKSIYNHIENNSIKNTIKLEKQDYGIFAERLGRRILATEILPRENKFLQKLFPEIEICSTKKINGYGDHATEVHYKYSKKMVIFEIKYGKVWFMENQLRKYCSMVTNPDNFFMKVDEVKVIYMVFEDINTVNNTARYFLKELNKNLASEILAKMEEEQ